MKELLQRFTAEQVNLMISEMFKDADPYYKKEGWPLLVFCSQVGKFAARVKEPAPVKKPFSTDLAQRLATRILIDGWEAVNIAECDEMTLQTVKDIVEANKDNPEYKGMAAL